MLIKDVKRRKTAIMKKIISIILLISILTLSFASCKKEEDTDTFSLDKYKTDTSTEAKEVYYVAMSVKDHGIIVLKLDAKNAPITVANFVKLVREGFYNGLTFHRVVNNFMIQGGDPEADGTGGSKNEIFGEFASNGYDNPIKHERGVISMARNGSNYNSASSQFFICNSNSSSVSGLDGDYAAFGHVVEGMSVVDSITSGTVKYASSSSGTIAIKSKQAVITEMKVIVYSES